MASQNNKKQVALVGRPNVGKSTLFNRLSIREKAIVHDMPGVTRDRKYADARIGAMEMLLVDTPGLEEAKEQALEHRMMQQTMLAIKEADVTCLVIDNLQGVTPTDKFFANMIRKYSDNYILIVNKCEKAFAGDGDIYKLGFGSPVPISAEHGIGLADLYDAMDEAFKKTEKSETKEQDLSKLEEEYKKHGTDTKDKETRPQDKDGKLPEDAEQKKFNEDTKNLELTDQNNGDQNNGYQSNEGLDNEDQNNGDLEHRDLDHRDLDNEDINLVIAGRPNAGKSTFINSLLREERMLTGPEAGITRESVEVTFKHKDRNFKLVDTAGLRKRSNVTKSLEKLSTGSTTHSIRFANMVVLMLDATIALEAQDLNIAGYAIEQGRGLVIAVNKWDLVKNKQEYLEEFEYKLETHLPQVKGIEAVFISSLKGKNVTHVLDACIKAFKLWNKRISTRKLNDQLGAIIDRHPLPLDKKLGRRVRIKYISQSNTRPPTFKLFCNLPDAITKSYERYLTNALRESFDLWGVPLRLRFTKSDNPYKK